ncbi:peptidoglycan-binding protein [Alphaproteobacteria bacterium]|nr:peptidoglycan-binding protein [Alphaproteobacteria bacterium]
MNFFFRSLILLALFSFSVPAYSAIYNGEKPLMKERTKSIANNHNYMRMCGGTLSKIAYNGLKRIKKLSVADYKIYKIENRKEEAKNYSRSVGCKKNEYWLISDYNGYITNLEKLAKKKKGGYTNLASSEKKKNSKYCFNPRTKKKFETTTACKNFNTSYVKMRTISKKQYDMVSITKLESQLLIGKSSVKLTYCLNTFSKKLFSTTFQCPKVKPANRYIEITKEQFEAGKAKKSSKIKLSKLSIGDNKTIQSLLKKEGFYLGDIDGNFGPNSIKALNKFQEANDLTVTTNLRADFLTFYKNFDNNKSAQSENLDNELTQSELQDEQIEARNYLNDFLEFFNNNSSLFDIIEITELISKNKTILTDDWNEIHKKEFKNFKEYTSVSKDFLEYYALQNDERQKQILNDIAFQNTKLKNVTSYFRYYLRNNITSDIASDVITKIKLAEDSLSLEEQNLATLTGVNADLDVFISSQKLSKDYKKFLSSLSPKDLEKMTVTISEVESYIDDKTTKTTLVYEEQQRLAQLYFQDLLLFIKDNPDTFDIIEITELIAKNKNIMDTVWNVSQKNNFLNLKNYTSNSNQFITFHTSLNDKRKIEDLNKISLASTKLKNIISYFKYYLKNNVTSDNATRVIQNIKSAENSLEQQSLGGLNNTNNSLEIFISNNGLSEQYFSFVQSLNSKDLEKNNIISNDIEDINLVNFEFIKNAQSSDFISLVNISTTAPHALRNLEGNIYFENNQISQCFYQSATINNDLRHYLVEKVNEPDSNGHVPTNGNYSYNNSSNPECDQNNLLDNYDLIFFEKDSLLRESKSYVSKLVSAIASDQFKLFKTVTKKEYEQDFTQRAMFAEQIENDIFDESRVGYGSLIINNTNEVLCTDVEETLAHTSIMSSLSNEFIRMGFGKTVTKTTYNSTEDTFKNVQRGKCGFIYAGEASLKNLLTGFTSTNTEYSFLPIWYSNKQIVNEQEIEENKLNNYLTNQQKKKEKLESEAKLNQELLKAEGILQAQEQEALRKRSSNIVEAHIKTMKKETKLLFNSDTYKDTWVYESYPLLGNFMDKKFKEGWEVSESKVSINDFGLSEYKGRKIETFMTDINFKLMNRDLGDYLRICFSIAIINDSEFDRWREPEWALCWSEELDKDLSEDDLKAKYKNSFNSYKRGLNFESLWFAKIK